MFEAHKDHHAVPISEDSLGDFYTELCEIVKEVNAIGGETLEKITDIDSKIKELKETVSKHFDEIRDQVNKIEYIIMQKIESMRNNNDGFSELNNLTTKTTDYVKKIKETCKNSSLSSFDKILSLTESIEKGKKLISEGANERNYTFHMDTEQLEDEMRKLSSSVRAACDVSLKKISLAPPQNIMTSELKPFSIVLAWDKKDGDKGYKIEVRDTLCNAFTVESQGNTICIGPLDSNTKYVFRVMAVRSYGLESKWSYPVTARTTSASLEKISNEFSGLSVENPEVCAKACNSLLSLIHNS